MTAPAHAADGDWETTATVTGASEADGLTVQVTGTDYVNLPPATGPSAGVYVALVPTTATYDDINAEDIVATAYVPALPAGNLNTTLTGATADLDPDADYEIVTWSAHGNINDDTHIDTATVELTAEQREALFPSDDDEPGDWSTDFEITGANATDGLTIQVTGTDYINLPKPTHGDTAGGVYVALRDTNTTSWDDLNNRQYTALSRVTGITDGAFTTTLNAAAEDLDPEGDYEITIWVLNGDINDDTLVDALPVSLTAEQLEALFPADENDNTWETVATVTGADEADGLTVEVTGTGYVDLPPATATSMGIYAALVPTTATYDDINAEDIPTSDWIMSLPDGGFTRSLTAAAEDLDPDADYEIVTWSAHGFINDDTHIDTAPVELTAEQREALFPGNPGNGDGNGDDDGNDDSVVNPRVTVNSTTVRQGGNLVINGTGFAPGERISATVHSDPVSLGSRAANASGAVQFTWRVPANFETGQHRVVLQSASGTAEIAFTVAAAAAQVTCRTETVPATAGAPQLSWGVKASFVSYVEGGIANGRVTASGGASRTGSGFLWGSGSGSLNSSGQGTVSFPGAVHFTGHDGQLNTRLSGLRVQNTGGNSGVLIANVASQDMDGNNTGGSNVTLANLRFSSWSQNGGNATATLTSAGSRAFAGFYDAGETLDNLTVSFSGARAATTQEVCYDADGNRINADGSPYSGTNGVQVNTGGYSLGGSNTSARGMELIGAGFLLAVLVLLRRTTWAS